MNFGIHLTRLVIALRGSAFSAASALAPESHEESGDHRERGDVPGWVMITLMSAVLVAGLLAIAGPALETMFNEAMSKVGK